MENKSRSGSNHHGFQHTKETSSFKTPSTGSIHMSNESYHELMAFKKAAKRDISASDSLKDEKYYYVFHRSFKATAMTQGLSDVCDVIPSLSQRGEILMNNNFLLRNKISFMLYSSRPSKLIMAEPLSGNMNQTKMLYRSCMRSNIIQTLNYPKLRS